MWHELVLHGVGGRTIEEAKERMTYPEFLSWCAFIAKRGSLNTGSRIEHGFALLATVISRTNGGKAQMKDFLPVREEPEPPSIEGTFRMLKAKFMEAKRGRP